MCQYLYNKTIMTSQCHVVDDHADLRPLKGGCIVIITKLSVPGVVFKHCMAHHDDFIIHYRDVIWTFTRLKSRSTRLFVLNRLSKSQKISQNHSTGPPSVKFQHMGTYFWKYIYIMTWLLFLPVAIKKKRNNCVASIAGLFQRQQCLVRSIDHASIIQIQYISW